MEYYYYRIDISFEKAGTPDFPDILQEISDAVTDYNSRSMLAANPKNICGYKLIGKNVLSVTLQSQQDLESPTKALRIFSQYFAQTHPEYLQGKRMFRMQAQRLPNYSEETSAAPETSDHTSDLLSDFEAMDTDEKLTAIYKMLIKIQGGRC